MRQSKPPALMFHPHLLPFRPLLSLEQVPALKAHRTASPTKPRSLTRRRSRTTMTLVLVKSSKQPKTVLGLEACQTEVRNQLPLQGELLSDSILIVIISCTLIPKIFRDPTPSPSPYIAPSPGGLPLPSPSLPLASPSALVTSLPCPAPLSPLNSPPPPSPHPSSPTKLKAPENLKLKKQANVLESSDEEEAVRTPALVKSKTKPVEKKKTPIRRKSSKSSNFKSNATISDEDSDSDTPTTAKRSLSTSPVKRPKPSPVQGRSSRPSSTQNTPVRGGRGSSGSHVPTLPPSSSAPQAHHSSPLKRSQMNVSSHLHLSAESDDDEEEEKPKAAAEKPAPAPDTVKKNSIKSRIFGPMLSKVTILIRINNNIAIMIDPHQLLT